MTLQPENDTAAWKWHCHACVQLPLPANTIWPVCFLLCSPTNTTQVPLCAFPCQASHTDSFQFPSKTDEISLLQIISYLLISWFSHRRKGGGTPLLPLTGPLTSSSWACKGQKARQDPKRAHCPCSSRPQAQPLRQLCWHFVTGN